MTSLKEAVYVGIALAIGFSIREYVRAAVTVRLGDPTPKQYGWASLNPKPKFDPFGTGFVPILVLVLIASGVHILPPFAYGKPLPLNPGNLRRPARDQTTIALSGPLANLALAAVAGALLRFGLPREGIIAVLAFFSTNLFLCVLHVMPIPGLDGSRIVARLLPPKAAETYRNLDPWLPLFVLVLFFVFGGIFFDIVNAITGGLCRVLAGSGVC